jgi:hypothetical protein
MSDRNDVLMQDVEGIGVYTMLCMMTIIQRYIERKRVNRNSRDQTQTIPDPDLHPRRPVGQG